LTECFLKNLDFSPA